MLKFNKIHIYYHGMLLSALLLLNGCGALTGLPGHGGGKRFAVEQELVASATRGAIKLLDLNALKGKKVNIYVNAIGDTGAGNLIGGRYSLVSQIRGDYVQTPPTIENYRYPSYTSSTTSSTTSSSSGVSSSSSTTSSTETVLPSPERKSSQQKGSGYAGQFGVEYKGLGAYQTSEEITSDDIQYLSALLQTHLFLNGIYVVPPSEAEVDIYLTVDVFGTIRTRVDWLFMNNEILKAKTIMEILAVDHITGEIMLPPQTAGTEAEYNEQYWFWVGPVAIKETLSRCAPLLSNISLKDEMKRKHLNEMNIDLPFSFKRSFKY